MSIVPDAVVPGAAVMPPTDNGCWADANVATPSVTPTARMIVRMAGIVSLRPTAVRARPDFHRLPLTGVAIQSGAVRVFLFSWLFVAVLIGYSGALRGARLPMPALGMAITLTLLFALAVRRDYRERALSVGVRALIAFHLTRFVGIYFLWLYNRGLLPRDMAVPAGWGDIIVAVLAIVVLLAFRPDTPRGRTAIMVWNIIGLTDIIMVLARASEMVERDPLMQMGFTSLPLSLLPTFLVPLIIATHVLIIVWWVQTRKLPTPQLSPSKP